MFPKIILTVMISSLGDINNEIELLVHKPISFATAFGIYLRTPLLHRAYNHHLCRTRHVAQADCEQTLRRAPIRAPEAIQNLRLRGGFLMGDVLLACSHSWTTCIQLRNTSVINEHRAAHDAERHAQGIVETLVGLICLGQRCREPESLFHLDARLTREAQQLSAVERCGDIVRYNQWHLNFATRLATADQLLERVRPSPSIALYWDSGAHTHCCFVLARYQHPSPARHPSNPYQASYHRSCLTK
jgi:hypothetical protein